MPIKYTYLVLELPIGSILQKQPHTVSIAFLSGQNQRSVFSLHMHACEIQCTYIIYSAAAAVLVVIIINYKY